MASWNDDGDGERKRHHAWVRAIRRASHCPVMSLSRFGFHLAPLALRFVASFTSVSPLVCPLDSVPSLLCLTPVWPLHTYLPACLLSIGIGIGNRFGGNQEMPMSPSVRDVDFFIALDVPCVFFISYLAQHPGRRCLFSASLSVPFSRMRKLPRYDAECPAPSLSAHSIPKNQGFSSGETDDVVRLP